MRRLLILVVILLVNLPAVDEAWTNHQISTKGIEVTGTVADARRINGRNLVDYLLPASIDPKQTRFSASLDLPTYRRAAASKELAVRVVPGSPGRNRPAGLVDNPLFRIVAVLADVILVLIAGLNLYRRRRPGDMGPAV